MRSGSIGCGGGASRLRRAAFTLPEVMVALFIMGIFVAGSVRVFTSLRQTTDLTRMKYQAVNLAKARLERVRALSFNQLDLAVESNIRVNELGNPDANGAFRRTTDVAPVTSALRLVTVTVDVRNPRTRRFDGGREQLMTLVADFGAVQ